MGHKMNDVNGVDCIGDAKSRTFHLSWPPRHAYSPIHMPSQHVYTLFAFHQNTVIPLFTHHYYTAIPSCTYHHNMVIPKYTFHHNMVIPNLDVIIIVYFSKNYTYDTYITDTITSITSISNTNMNVQWLGWLPEKLAFIKQAATKINKRISLFNCCWHKEIEK